MDKNTRPCPKMAVRTNPHIGPTCTVVMRYPTHARCPPARGSRQVPEVPHRAPCVCMLGGGGGGMPVWPYPRHNTVQHTRHALPRRGASSSAGVAPETGTGRARQPDIEVLPGQANLRSKKRPYRVQHELVPGLIFQDRRDGRVQHSLPRCCRVGEGSAVFNCVGG